MKRTKLVTAICMLAVLVLLSIIALPTEAQAATTASGTCGDNLTWTLDDTGTLTITGTGAMHSWVIGSSPWYNNTAIKTIVIGDSVTSIGDAAFYYCTSLQSMTIPDGITTIGSGAFSCCTSLTSVTIPDGVTSIDSRMFDGCMGLTSLIIPASVTIIGDFAFQHCTSLTNVYYAGTQAQWNAISIGSGNSNLLNATIHCVGSDFTYEVFDGKVTITGYTGSSGDITIPATLGGYPVTSIGNSAFYSCASLTSVTIPDSVESIDRGAFASCTSLTNVTIGDSVESIGVSAFTGCTSLTSVTIPDSVTSIGDYAFKSCASLTSVTISDSVESIDGWAFSFCASLTSVTIPDSMTSIGSSAFYSCASLTNVYYAGTQAQWNAISIDYDNDDLTSATIHYNHPAHDFTTDSVVCSLCGYVRANVAITNVVLRPACSGLYFKGTFDFGIEENVTRYGIAVSLYNDLPVADDSDATSLYTIGNNSVLISNILSESKNGKMLIYARPYVLLEDGTYIYGDVVVTNLKSVVETIDAKFDTLTTAQQTAIADLYRQNTTAMQDWLIPKIKELV